MTTDLYQRTIRTRALSRISGARDGRRYGQRFSAARETDLLAYAATLPDEVILEWSNTGPGILAWIRTHQPVAVQTETTLAWLMKSYGWRVEVFWNSGGRWFTARLVDGDGNLVPRGDPLGVGAASPGQALADLHDAVLGGLA
jgi:hypothetical protein